MFAGVQQRLISAARLPSPIYFFAGPLRLRRRLPHGRPAFDADDIRD